ncbi:KilA-N, DNA-binding domain [Moorella glycerini]|uniref:ORF6N domain protein n=1 Tax=Neomoorella stamsii TaxID=1266720 RepID=A0A9X7J1C7_9FIRM|nr:MULTISPECIES: ORF6N domain-containing protein [Moorella]PRR69639.1 ORF6N domain protein [Moorella stamsii]CEP67837.1 KilA-N, DNA-binding domain [Moorella glycerini]
MGQVVQLTVAGHQREVIVKEFNGQRVVTFRDIDELHQRPEGTARKRFNDNRKHFIEGEDFFVVPRRELRPEFGLNSKEGNPNIEVILLTESGYLMLVKSFTDDLAWQVQRQLVNVYFRAKGMAKELTEQAKRAEAMLINARTRQEALLRQMAREFKDVLSPESIQLLIAGATELVVGKPLLPKPQIDVTFTATEIAEEAGVSANKVGRVANKYGLKTSEYGMWVLDKSASSDKQVKNFVYNEKGRQKLLELIKAELRLVPMKPEKEEE